jgi:hypothetical protein
MIVTRDETMSGRMNSPAGRTKPAAAGLWDVDHKSAQADFVH